MPVKSPVPNWLEPHLPVCEAIVALFAPLAEVAVHDIRRDRIVGIWNPISGRKVGDRSLIDELPPVLRRTRASSARIRRYWPTGARSRR